MTTLGLDWSQGSFRNLPKIRIQGNAGETLGIITVCENCLVLLLCFGLQLSSASVERHLIISDIDCSLLHCPCRSFLLVR